MGFWMTVLAVFVGCEVFAIKQWLKRAIVESEWWYENMVRVEK
jgi:hypothetical protein